MLIQVVTAFSDEVDAIRRVFHEGHAAQDVGCNAMPYCPLDDGCVVSLWDAWNRFMRNLYLTSAAGGATMSAKAEKAAMSVEKLQLLHEDYIRLTERFKAVSSGCVRPWACSPLLALVALAFTRRIPTSPPGSPEVAVEAAIERAT